MPIRTPDGQELQIDLLAVLGQFRAACYAIVRVQEIPPDAQGLLAGLKPVGLPGSASMDDAFERQLDLVNRHLREWWKDYKRDWRKIYQA